MAAARLLLRALHHPDACRSSRYEGSRAARASDLLLPTEGDCHELGQAEHIQKASTPLTQPCGKCQDRSGLLARFASLLAQQLVPGLVVVPWLG